MSDAITFESNHRISVDWECYFYDEPSGRKIFSIIHLPTDSCYSFRSGSGMPVEQITDDMCSVIADHMDWSDANIGLMSFRDYLDVICYESC